MKNYTKSSMNYIPHNMKWKRIAMYKICNTHTSNFLSAIGTGAHVCTYDCFILGFLFDTAVEEDEMVWGTVDINVRLEGVSELLTTVLRPTSNGGAGE